MDNQMNKSINDVVKFKIILYEKKNNPFRSTCNLTKRITLF